MITWKELKERRLFQIVASYAVAGWVILGVFDQVIDRGILPEILYRILFIFYFGGMVAAVVIGWFHGEKGEQKVTRPEVALLSVVALLTIGVAGLTVQRQLEMGRARMAAGESGLSLQRVAVLYFRDLTRGEDLTYLADGLTESLIERLSQSQTLDVLSRNASSAYRDSTIPVDSIAKALGAGTIVDGTVERRGSRVRASFTLFDGAGGAEIQRGQVERPAEDIFALQDEVTGEVALLLGRWLAEEVELRQARGGTEDVLAWTHFQRGERLREEGARALDEGEVDAFKDGYRAADSLYAEAERSDPAWATPLVRRALLTDLLAQVAAREDPRQAESWVNAGIQYADRALQMDPRSAEAFLARGRLEYFRWRGGLLRDPRASEDSFQRALTDLEEATRLDPAQAEGWSILSLLYSEKADNTGAKLAARSAYEADEFLRSADEILFRLYATSYDLEQFRDATDYCDQGRRRFPRHVLFRECRLWLLAAPSPQAPEPNPDEAWSTLEGYLQVAPRQAEEYLRL